MPDSHEPSEHEFSAGGLVKPFLDHLEDLRKTLIKCVLAVAVMMGVCLAFLKQIIGFVQQPLVWSGLCTDPNKFLNAMGVADPLTIPIKVAIYGGLLLSIPLILFFIGQFVLPALTSKERGHLWPAFTAGAVMFLAGVAFCFFVLVPQTLKLSRQMGDWLGWQMPWTVQSYYSFVIQFSLAMGLGFEIPVLVLVLVRIGILTDQTLRKYRRHVIIVNVIAAAIITPGTDIMSLCLVAVPMCILYEFCIWIAWWMCRRRARAETAI